jgi:RNA polymerase sigma factor (sigma-70 family)
MTGTSVLVQQLRALIAGPLAEGQTDQHLLEQFLSQRDEPSFAALVERHGPVVLGVCRRILQDEHLAEDAFQATFLVLARKAATICKRQSVGSWLHGVALRLARKVKAGIARSKLPRARSNPPGAVDPHAAAIWHEAREILDEEIQRLPENYRLPLVLCYLEGLTRDEAAVQLGWSADKLRGLLDRGRERLRSRLIRRGVTLSAAGAATLLADTVSAATVPPLLAVTTIHAAARFAAGIALAPCGISAPVVALTDGGLRMIASKTRTLILALALVAGVLGSGAAILAQRTDPTPAVATGPKDGAGPVKKPERPTKASLDALLPVESWHTFGPVNPEWKSKVTYLLNDGGDDPPNSLVVVEPDARDPNVKEYRKEVRYFAKEGDKRERRILRYYPDGSLWCDMDIVGDEQFDCSYDPDGTVRGFVHWRKGKWIGGYSVSPDGATIHRLAGGTGELVTYGKKLGNAEHRWYCEGVNFLSKQYRNESVTTIRLNGADDWLIVDKTEERLLATSEREIWNNPAGGVPRVQKFDAQPFADNEHRRVPDPGEVQRTTERYALRRTAFLETYDKFLTRGGYAWDKLGIAFLRKGTTWPY